MRIDLLIVMVYNCEVRTVRNLRRLSEVHEAEGKDKLMLQVDDKGGDECKVEVDDTVVDDMEERTLELIDEVMFMQEQVAD